MHKGKITKPIVEIIDINYRIAVENDISARDWAKILRLYTDLELALLDLDSHRSKLSKEFLEVVDREKLDRGIEKLLVE